MSSALYWSGRTSGFSLYWNSDTLYSADELLPCSEHCPLCNSGVSDGSSARAGVLRGAWVTRAPSLQTGSHVLTRELDNRSLTLDLACLWKGTASLPQQDSKSHHPSPGFSASTKIRNTFLFFTDNVVLVAQVDKDNWLISQSREVHWAFRAVMFPSADSL